MQKKALVTMIAGLGLATVLMAGGYPGESYHSYEDDGYRQGDYSHYQKKRSGACGKDQRKAERYKGSYQYNERSDHSKRYTKQRRSCGDHRQKSYEKRSYHHDKCGPYTKRHNKQRDVYRDHRSQYDRKKSDRHSRRYVDGRRNDSMSKRYSTRNAYSKKAMRTEWKELRALFRSLDLTDTQRAEIKTVLKEQRQQNKAAQKGKKQRSKQSKRIAATAFMSAEKFDKEAFMKSVKEKQAQRRAAFEAKMDQKLAQRAALIEKIFAVLTPEQREKWIAASQQP